MNNMFSPSSLKKTLAVGFILLIAPSLRALENFQKHVVMQKNLTVQGSANLHKIVTEDVNAKNVTAENVKSTSKIVLASLEEGRDCCKKIWGVIPDFDPHRDLLAIDFCEAAPCPTDQGGFHGAIVNLTFCTTCTPNQFPPEWQSCHAFQSANMEVLVEKLYVSPGLSGVTNKFHFFIDDQPFYVNADKVNDDVPSDCELKVYVNQNPFLSTRMLVDLVIFDNNDTIDLNGIQVPSVFFQKQTCSLFTPGCLFYEVTSCNLVDVTKTTTDAKAFDTLPAALQALVAEVTSDPLLQEALALDILSIGQEFITLLLGLDHDTAITVLQQLLDDITKHKSSGNKLSSKLKATVKNHTKLIATLRNSAPKLRAMLDQPEENNRSVSKSKCSSCSNKKDNKKNSNKK